MKKELQELIKSAKEFKEFQSIGNGAKLNCAIEAAELVPKRIVPPESHAIALKALDEILRANPLVTALEMQEIALTAMHKISNLHEIEKQ